jgi:hypothetical protein
MGDEYTTLSYPGDAFYSRLSYGSSNIFSNSSRHFDFVFRTIKGILLPANDNLQGDSSKSGEKCILIESCTRKNF